MSVMTAALMSSLAMLLSYGINWGFGQCMTERPIVTGTITGLLLGDVKTGVLVGAQLEAIYMGVVNIGGAMAAEPNSATVLATTFVIWGGMEMETALTAIAVPVGLMFNTISLPLFFISNLWAEPYDKACERGDVKTVSALFWLGFFVRHITRASIIFVAVAFGAEPLANFLGNLPPVVMAGLGKAAGLFGAVGMSILMRMLWSTELAIWYFAGFILVKYLNLPLIVVACIAIIVAIPTALRDIEILNLKKSGLNVQNNEVEDFFG